MDIKIIADAIKEEKRVLNSDLSATKRMLENEKTPERYEAFTRLVQAINAFERVEALLKG